MLTENLLKTPVTGKKFHAPLQSGRKALGAVNKIPSMPAVNGQKNKLLETQVISSQFDKLFLLGDVCLDLYSNHDFSLFRKQKLKPSLRPK